MKDTEHGESSQIIDQACDQFEAALQAGGRPRIEDFLDVISGAGRSELLHQLLVLEVAYRARWGEGPTPREYQARFPGQGREIKAAFRKLPARSMPRRGRPETEGPNPFPRMMPGRAQVALAVTAGPDAGAVFTFRQHDTFIVGRDIEAHFRIALEDRYVSRHHFMIEANPPRCRLMDMASKNGTYLNGQLVGVIDLHDGDVIRAGHTEFWVALGSGEPREEPIPALASKPKPVELPPGGEPIAVPGYRIERELGRGGMGIVFLARHGDDEAPVALKMIIPAAAGSEGAVARFLREASALRQLVHSNIVGFREIGQAGGRLYFAMEYVPGTDAEVLLKQHGGPLPISRAVNLAGQVLEALSYAHGRGFVHRDIKPRNLLLALSGDRDLVKLTDFGLARLYENSPLSGLTLTGQIFGTPAFMAPEQITRFRESRPTVDLYSVGATLYYLLTEQPIYDFPSSIEERLLMILKEEPVPIRSRRSGIPEGLSAIIHRSLSRDPARRFPDAGAMRQALLTFEDPVSQSSGCNSTE